MAQPFVYPYGREEGRYIYDCNSNEIVAVGELLFELVPAFESNMNPSVLSLLKRKYGTQLLASAIDRIQDAQKAGLFSPNRPQQRVLPFTREKVDRALSCEMSSMVLCITEKCNLRCRYCLYSGKYRARRQHSSRSMTFQVAKDAINYLISHSTEREEPLALSFYGGEPLLEFQLLKKCVEYFYKKAGNNSIVSISTNGTRLSRETIVFLEKNRIYLFISLDGPREIHDAWRKYQNGRGSFDHVMDGIRSLRNFSPSYWHQFVSLLVTLIPPIDVSLLDDFFDGMGMRTRPSYVEAYDANLDIHKDTKVVGVDALAKKYLHACCGGVFDRPQGDFRRNSFCRGFFSPALRAIHLRSKSSLGAVSEIHGACIPGAQKTYVSVDGKFFICEKTEGSSMAAIGDVYTGIQKKHVHQILDEFESLDWSKCFDCWIVRMCPICYLHVLHGESWDVEKRNRICEQFRKYYSFCLNLYCEILERNKRALDYLESEDQRPSP